VKLLDYFSRKEREQARQDLVANTLLSRLDELIRESPLTKATEAVGQASSAMASGELNAAWGLYQEAKEHYMAHAVQCNYTAAQVIDLDSSMSRPLADILRQENKHFDALVHIVYWAAGTEMPLKIHKQQVASYFKRCKFRRVELEDVTSLVSISRVDTDFVRIRDTIGAWRDAD